jgi:hypothetical protein
MSKQPPFYLRSKPNPKNDPAEWLPDFETEEQVAERYAARERLMFRGKSMSQPNFHWCTQDTPCDSGACPFCMRSFRRWLVDAGRTLFEERGDPLSVASLVHHSLSRFPGHLNTFDLRKAKRQLARHVDRAGLGALVAIGGFDFSYNQPTAPVNSYWQPHAYVIFQGAEPEIVKQALSPFYPATTNIPRPIRTRRVCDLMQALSYAMKAVFSRRSSYADNQGRPNTRGFDLKPEAERELISYLDQLKPNDRLFLENVRRLGATLIRSKV